MPVSLVWWTDYILFGGAVRRSHIMAALSPQRPLHVAAKTGRLPEVERLVSEGPSVRVERAGVKPTVIVRDGLLDISYIYSLDTSYMYSTCYCV